MKKALLMTCLALLGLVATTLITHDSNAQAPTADANATARAAFAMTLTAQAEAMREEPTATPMPDNRATDTPFEMVVFYNASSLTLMVFGSEMVSLEGIGVRVEGRGELDLSSLRALRDVTFESLSLPFCIHLRDRDDEEDVPPDACLSMSNRVREISPADVIWYDSVVRVEQAIEITRYGAVQGECNFANEPCFVTYTPLVPLATPIPTTTSTPLPNGTAATYIISDQIVETRIELVRDQMVSIRAEGRMVFGEFVGGAGPDGTESLEGFPFIPIDQRYDLVQAFPHGVLMYRIGRDGDWEACSSRCEFSAASSGELQLFINDNNTTDNSGRFEVEVELG